MTTRDIYFYISGALVLLAVVGGNFFSIWWNARHGLDDHGNPIPDREDEHELTAEEKMWRSLLSARPSDTEALSRHLLEMESPEITMRRLSRVESRAAALRRHLSEMKGADNPTETSLHPQPNT